MKPYIPLFVLLMLANCTSKGENGNGAPASADVDVRSHDLTAGLDCEPSFGLLECLRRNEASAAKKHDVELAREDGELCLSSPAATRVCLQDRAGLGHVFFERVEGYFVVVETEDIGGYTVLMVSEQTGHRSRVDNRPLFSPGAPLFATVSYDTDAGYLPNRVAIRDATSNALLYEVDWFAPGTGPVAIRWTAPVRLQVNYSRSEYAPGPDENTDTFSIWRDETGTWSGGYTR